ncbi:MAG: cytochrome C biogenesis protein [Elusimicrobia bacterium CG06_land_8_20_14_3_00_38_11]|nr:MAG: cytochrome C biogenesis protein [Elusimicrobia bacterium CG06_land_8_20_14_3_00_38_11]
MILEIFNRLTSALNSTPEIAIISAYVWGILSIILSPCHLASIPLIVGFIDEQGKISTKRAFFISLFFALGILITIAVIGVLTGLLGRIMGDVGKYGNYFVAVIFFIVGLHLLGIIPLNLKGANAAGYKNKGLMAAFVLGLIFGIALGPCTFAYMAPMLGIVFTTASTNLFFAVSLIFFYAVGHCSVIVFAGTFTEIVQHYLNWNEKSKGAVILKKICGVLIISGGIYLLYIG